MSAGFMDLAHALLTEHDKGEDFHPFDEGSGVETADDDYAAKHKDALKRALTALFEGVAYIKANPDAVIPQLAKYDGVSVEVARAFGLSAFRITHRHEVEGALDKLLAAEGPTLLHVLIDPRENVWPLVPPGASNAEMMEERWDEPLDSY